MSFGAALLLPLLAAAACSGKSKAATLPVVKVATSTPTPSSPPPTLATPLSIAEADAVAAYKAMWTDMAAVARTADYQSPRLADHATGAALSVLTRGIYTDKRLGLIVKGTPVTDPSATSAVPASSPTTVQISDCFDDRKWLNYKLNGQLQDNVPGGLHHTTATAVEASGAWKISILLVRGVGTC